MNAKFIVEGHNPTVYNEQGEPAVRASDDMENGAGSWIARIVGEFAERVGQTRPADYPEGPCTKIPGYLASESDITNIQSCVIALPFGWEGPAGTDTKNREEVGRMMGENAPKMFRAWRPAMVSLGIPATDVDHWIEEAEIDLATSRSKVYMDAYYWIGRVNGDED